MKELVSQQTILNSKMDNATTAQPRLFRLGASQLGVQHVQDQPFFHPLFLSSFPLLSFPFLSFFLYFEQNQRNVFTRSLSHYQEAQHVQDQLGWLLIKKLKRFYSLTQSLLGSTARARGLTSNTARARLAGVFFLSFFLSIFKLYKEFRYKLI